MTGIRTLTGIVHHHTGIASSAALDDPRRFKAKQLRTEGLTDDEIAKRLMQDAKHGSKQIITADDVWRWCHQVEREQRAG